MPNPATQMTLNSRNPAPVCALIDCLQCPQAGHSYFRIHPKGNGIVVQQPGGLPPITFVSEYLGEMHTPARWFEIQVRPQRQLQHS